MDIEKRVQEATQEKAAQLPDTILERGTLSYVPPKDVIVDPGALTSRVNFLAEGGSVPSKAEFERLLGTNDLVDEFYLERALLAAHPLCRISLRATSGRELGCATGFMISPRLLITNHHVFPSEEDAAPSIVEFDYRLDIAGRPVPSVPFGLRPDLFFFNDKDLDFAIVSVEPRSLSGDRALSEFGYHKLIPETGKVRLNEWMTIIQHPGGERRQFAIRENQCVKIDDPDVLWYVSDTAQGSSGAPVFNDSFQVAALHHSGVARRDDEGNYLLKSGKTVRDLDDIDDSDVDWIANAGIRVSRICASIASKAIEKNGHLAELNAAMKDGDVLSNAFKSRPPAIVTPQPNIAVEEKSMNDSSNNAQNGSVRLVIGTLVLELNGALLGSSVSHATSVVVTPEAAKTSPAEDVFVEAFKEPLIDRDYSKRSGFDTGFLEIGTPLLEVRDENLIAPMKNGNKVIPYEHFSIVLHRNRKLAIFTASNVDASVAAKKPEPGKNYTRKVLNGFSGNEMEKWAIDDRVDEQFQIPDKFYTKDNGAFDKGHIVRREDVCFGDSFAQVQRANGDTFHVTNCSPQLGNFNQSGKDGIWGHLEDFVASQADTERLCLFAGPVLSENDKIFRGTEAVQIPSRFWKVVCAVKQGKLQVFAFLLEQDLKNLPLEFFVSLEWKANQKSLKELEEIIGLVRFPDVYHEADQFIAQQ